MNRIDLPTETMSASSTQAQIPASLARRTIERIRLRGDDVAAHTTFGPVHYEQGYAYPLVVWLHGASGNERQLRRVMPDVSIRNYVGVAPRGPCADHTAQGTYCWRQTADAIEQAESRIFDCVEIAKCRFHVNPRRIFLVGLGCGGTMAFRVAWNHPGAFAGVATFGGPMPKQDRPLRHVNALRQLPCFAAIGRHSREYPELDVCRDLRLMHAAGCMLDVRQYPCGDELTTDMLADLDRWIMGLINAEA
jgi:phospholipase/carboxylesterase